MANPTTHNAFAPMFGGPLHDRPLEKHYAEVEDDLRKEREWDEMRALEAHADRVNFGRHILPRSVKL